MEITSDILKARLAMQEYDAKAVGRDRSLSEYSRLEADITRLALECLARRAADEGAVEFDTERLDWLEAQVEKGMAPAIMYDDDGHWAVSFCGSSPCPQGDGKGYDEPVDLGAFFEPEEWKPTIREAIDYAMSSAAEPAGGEG